MTAIFEGEGEEGDDVFAKSPVAVAVLAAESNMSVGLVEVSDGQAQTTNSSSFDWPESKRAIGGTALLVPLLETSG